MKGFSISEYRLRLLGVLFIALTLLPAASDNSARIEHLGHQLMCVCGCNQILLECNHVGCTYSERMRSELTTTVDSSNSDRGVLQTFIDKYGTTVLAAPPNSGFNRVVWLVPYFALAVGLFGVVLVARNWKGRVMVAVEKNQPAATPDLDRFREQARKETDL